MMRDCFQAKGARNGPLSLRSSSPAMPGQSDFKELRFHEAAKRLQLREVRLFVQPALHRGLLRLLPVSHHYTALLGFTDCKGLGNTTWHFLTDEPFKNFVSVLQNPSFIKSLGNTVKLWIMNFIPQITLALLLTAWFTSHRHKLAGQGFFKVVFYMPNIITAASVAILFNALFGYPTGPVNDLLVTTGVLSTPFNFSINATAAQLIVAFIQFWMWYGYTMIILISGVLGISPEIYEAAEMTGPTTCSCSSRSPFPT